MEFDWALYDPAGGAPTQQVEECFEDPFSLRLIPDIERIAGQNRFFCLGQDRAGGHWAIVYVSTGKAFRIIAVRPMSPEEEGFYERKLRESL